MSDSIISLTFDDGLRCQLETGIPVLHEFHLPATFFLIANQDPIHEHWYGNTWPKIEWNDRDIETLKKLISEGHEIGSHSLTHRMEKIKADPIPEAVESKRLIESWLGTEITSFCYPYYTTHTFLYDHVKSAGYEQARGAPSNSVDRFNIGCKQILKTGEVVSSWIQPGRWHVLTFHGIGTDKDGWEPVSVQEFFRLMRELADYRDTGKVRVLTFGDAAKLLPQGHSL